MIKVSVLMITYNHEKFIEQAVRGVMMQQTNFDYQLIVGEDCSTDRTRDILCRLKEEFPDKIILLLHPQNIGMIPNMVATYEACQGEYIALCEGDDYWKDPYKLQKQVTYLDANPECRMCFHAAKIVFEDESRDHNSLKKPPSGMKISLQTWMRYTYIATGSVIFRKPDEALPEWYSRLHFSGDYPLFVWLLLTIGGKLVYIDEPEPMSVYRRHAGGVTHGDMLVGSRIQRMRLMGHLQDLQLVRRNLPFSQRKHLRIRVLQRHLQLTKSYLLAAQQQEARHHLLRSIWYLSTARHELLRFLALALRCYFPGAYAKISRAICAL